MGFTPIWHYCFMLAGKTTLNNPASHHYFSVHSCVVLSERKGMEVDGTVTLYSDVKVYYMTLYKTEACFSVEYQVSLFQATTYKFSIVVVQSCLNYSGLMGTAHLN